MQRFKIDTTITTGMVENDDDAIEEEVEKRREYKLGWRTQEDEDEDEAPCGRVLETSEGVVASSFMDAVIVVVDFREKDGSVPSVSFGSLILLTYLLKKMKTKMEKTKRLLLP